jgi:RNA polymerase sigma factor (sigma-70 family)
MAETPKSAENPPASVGGALLFDTSMQLLLQAQGGDEEALNALLERYLPALRRWAGGRLPRWARDRFDTQDLIQETILGVLPHIQGFEPRREGALRAYMRQALLNRIRREIRRVQHLPRRDQVEIDGGGIDCPDPAASPLEEAIGKEALECYEAALLRLRTEDREAIITRLEMRCTFEQLADVLDKPSADAARMAVRRALLRLVQEMDLDA